MKIGIVDVDSHNFPNLALMKISSYEKSIGNHVELVNHTNKYDRVYKSKIFTYTQDEETLIMTDELILGGTGYDIKTNLPSNIESCFPDYSLFPEYSYAVGYLTRGCSRGCDFCIVKEKEGSSHKVADLKDFWNGQKEIQLLDPNILEYSGREELLDQLAKSKSCVEFNQGLDVRLYTKEVSDKIKQIRIKRIHFAYDTMDQKIEEHLKRAVSFGGLRRQNCTVYVMVNFNTSFEEDLHRIYFIKSLMLQPYVMIYDKGSLKRGDQYFKLSRWVNSPMIFWSVDNFYEYDRKLN